MSRATLIIRNDRDRAEACRFIQNAPILTAVTFKRNRRTVDQNSKLWACLTDVARDVVWYGEKLTAEDWKTMFTAALRKTRIVPGIEGGGFVPLGMRTSDMTKEELSDLLELIMAFGAERGVKFHDSDQDGGAANNRPAEVAA
jgi:hypothetical protein